MSKRAAKLLLTLFLLILITGCGKKDKISVSEAKSTEVLKVVDESITEDIFYIYVIQYILNNSLTDASLGESKADDIKNSSINEIRLEYVEYQLAKVTEGVEIPEGNLKKAQASADEFYDYFGSGFLSEFGIDKETIDKLFEIQVYADTLVTKARKDLTEDYYKQYVEQFDGVTFHSVYYALFPTVVYDDEGNVVLDEDGKPLSVTDEEKKQLLERADKYRERAVEGLKSGDDKETMEALADEYGIAEYSGIERNYSGAYSSEELNELVEKLNDGEISGVTETDFGYMIVRMDKKDDQDYKDYLLDYLAYQNSGTLISELQNTWLSSSGVSDADINSENLAKIDVKRVLDKIKEYNIVVN